MPDIRLRVFPWSPIGQALAVVGESIYEQLDLDAKNGLLQLGDGQRLDSNLKRKTITSEMDKLKHDTHGEVASKKT